MLADDRPIQTDCDTGPGGSGAGQFAFLDWSKPLSHDNLVLVAINVFQVGEEMTGRPYDPVQYYNVSVPLVLDFHQAILDNLK